MSQPQPSPAKQPKAEKPARRMTIVVNNKEALIQGQLPHRGKDKDSIPQLGPVVTLLPGANLVDSEDLATLRQNDQFDLYFVTLIPPSKAPEGQHEKVGHPYLKILTSIGDQGVVPASVAGTLRDLSEEQARTLIAETFDPRQIRTWLRNEGRPDIRVVLHQTMEMMRTGEAPGGAATAGR